MAGIQNQRAIVTGATRGIGAAIARSLLEKGARVLICGRTDAELESAVAKLRHEFAGAAYGVRCDVRNPEDVEAMFKRAAAELGGLDILINNAGIGFHSRVEETSVEEWEATLETNLTGVFLCCREAIKLMKRAGGYIINIGSLAGKNATPGMAAYCASKFGLMGFTESLMQEVRYDHIRVSCVMPGSVNTNFGRSREQDRSETWKLLAEDVAAVVINLLEMEPRALPSRVELRPSEPKK